MNDFEAGRVQGWQEAARFIEGLRGYNIDGSEYELSAGEVAQAAKHGIRALADGLAASQTVKDDIGVQIAAKVLLPVFLRKHEEWARSKGRNPLDYTSVWQQAADRLDAITKGQPL